MSEQPPSRDLVPSSGSPPLREARPRYVGTGDEGRLVPPDWLSEAPVTRALLALNVAVFVIELTGGGLAWLLHVPTTQLLKLGGCYPLATVGDHRWETLLTACFLHGGLLHLVFNMVALWQAGPLVERAVGSARMAPMYLAAGAFGNLMSVAFHLRAGMPTVGASGAISGVIAAALVVGWRVQGWRGPLTQAMAGWLAFVVLYGLLWNRGGGSTIIDNAAHAGGGFAGAAIAALWRRGYRYSVRATKLTLAACVAVLLLCIGVLAWRDSTDPFASLSLQDRFDFTQSALAEGRCQDAYGGLRAVERLRRVLGPVTSLRSQVEGTCGHLVDR